MSRPVTLAALVSIAERLSIIGLAGLSHGHHGATPHVVAITYYVFGLVGGNRLDISMSIDHLPRNVSRQISRTIPNTTELYVAHPKGTQVGIVALSAFHHTQLGPYGAIQRVDG